MAASKICIFTYHKTQTIEIENFSNSNFKLSENDEHTFRMQSSWWLKLKI